MKQLINISVLLFLFSISKIYGQTYNFETTDLSISVKDNTKKWSDFANPKDVKISVVLDTKKDRITIYSEIYQFFKIVNYKEKQIVNNRDIVSFDCVNQEGTKCLLAIHTINDQKNSNQLYVYFKDIVLIYNMIYVE
ncbi:hypothetical protein [Flavobacterium sp.]|uniref:hypothetical protein n=1 Tax=Flavobacterium sp. TaxID=239 RepID=UPI00286D9F6B|nr:hypothetical protein [Flavobacterium sp.]